MPLPQSARLRTTHEVVGGVSLAATESTIVDALCHRSHGRCLNTSLNLVLCFLRGRERLRQRRVRSVAQASISTSLGWA